MRTRIRAAVLAILVGLGAAACTTTRAATPVERPPLEVPPPPPRLVVPLPAPQPNQLEPVENLEPPAPTAPRPRPPREKETPKVEPKPEEPKPAEPPLAAPPAQQPLPQLRMPDSSGSPQVSQIMDAIARSKAILKDVSYGLLSNVAKKAYNESKMFATQAEDALKTNNLPFAKELAEKAESLAKGLQGR